MGKAVVTEVGLDRISQALNDAIVAAGLTWSLLDADRAVIGWGQWPTLTAHKSGTVHYVASQFGEFDVTPVYLLDGDTYTVPPLTVSQT